MNSASQFTRPVEIFAATSSGCSELAHSIGLPLACVRVSSDVDATIDAMNETSHGGAALWLDSFQPFEPQRGWSDWRLLPFAPISAPCADIRFESGRICLDLPATVAVTVFEAELRAELGRIRLESVTTSPAWLLTRCESGERVFVPPRYTLSDPTDFRAGARKVDDLVVIDPTVHLALVSRLAERARTRSVLIAGEARHAD